MKKHLIILILFFSISCNDKKPVKVENNELKKKDVEISERLKKHFELYKVTPSVIVNNNNYNQREIKIESHIIKWFDNESETKIKIDNNLFSLKGKMTLNIVNHNKDDVDFANNWDEIKLYKHNNKEYIGISMLYFPCNGLACSVNYYLIYDVSTETENYFGTFGGNNGLELYNFSNDYKIDYVSQTLVGDIYGEKSIEYLYELYSVQENGEFKQTKDNNNLSYQIKHKIYHKTRNEDLIENWVTKIK